MKKEFSLRYIDKCCHSCKYYREHKTMSWTADCLFLGRTLQISNDHHDFWYVQKSKVCDGWKRRPKKWKVIQEKNPYFHDEYISRESLNKIRKRAGIES